MGWAFKKDTNDTRETAALYVADYLIEETANIHVFDPKVSAIQMQTDLNYLGTRDENKNIRHLITEDEPYSACKNSHAVAILTEWDEFRDYDWDRIFKSMKKPAFVFDGRNILDKKKLESIGFKVYQIGK